MKKSFTLFLALHFFSQAFSQCTSNRYLDTIFTISKIDVLSDIKYQTATPYGVLSQPTDYNFDFYSPSQTVDTLRKRPLIIYMFGAAFISGFKIQPPIPRYGNYYAQLGYCFASIDYRTGFNTVSTGSVEREVYRAVQDERAAIRFFVDSCVKYGIDTNAIFLMGSSAGCITAFHCTFMEQADAPASYQGITLEPADLGCIECSGNTNHKNKGMGVRIRGIVNQWGAILDTNYISALPKDNVPVISFHGTNDNVVPYVYGNPFSYPVFPNVYGSKTIHDRLNTVGIKNKLVPLVGYGHEPELLNQNLIDTVWNQSRVFMYDLLRPAAQRITGDSIVCLNEKGNYAAVAKDGSRYCWTISGGGTIVQKVGNTLAVNWTSTGSYIVTVREMTLNDVNGDLDSFTVRVIARPKANFGFTQNQLAVSFTDSSISAAQWIYHYGDGVTGNTQNPTHSFPAPGTYTTQLIVSNHYCTDTAYRSFNLDTCPTVQFTYRISNDTIYFVGDTSNGVKFQWVFGDGGKDSGTLKPFHVYTASQNYLVALKITNAKGCAISGSQIVPFHLHTGIEDVAFDYALFPNPVSDYLRLACSDCTYQLTTILGEPLQAGKIQTEQSISLEALSKGVYLLQLTKDGAKAMKRIVKE